MDSPFFIINSPHFGGTVSKISNSFLSPFYTIKSKTKTKRAWPDSQALLNFFCRPLILICDRAGTYPVFQYKKLLQKEYYLKILKMDSRKDV